MSDPSPLGKGTRLTAALSRLAGTIDARADRDPGVSYTAKLLARGPLHCGKKVGEEAVELALAVAAQDRGEVVSEAGDVLYHLLVALKARGISLDEVGDALAAREARSGLEEKASRPSG
ncbi:MAG: phosphoribosyl-ATP diphosphatase [Pseudomonadota bacterium]